MAQLYDYESPSFGGWPIEWRARGIHEPVRGEVVAVNRPIRLYAVSARVGDATATTTFEVRSSDEAPMSDMRKS